MKKMFFTALTFIMLCATASAQDDWRIHPDDANYKIYGYFETKFNYDGSPYYELTQVRPEGFSFDTIKDKYNGGLTTSGNVFFTFDHVTYSGKPDLDNIALWVYDDELRKWQADKETNKESSQQFSTNEMTVMLVLDCSTSLSTDGFYDVKQAAKSFIDVMLNASNAGNIHIGIIGFSTIQQTRTLKLQPLTATSVLRMKNFIDALERGNGTALYRSFDDAIDYMQDYVKDLRKFAGAAVVTFTDGLDNGSLNNRKRIGNKVKYFQHLKNEVIYKNIGGQPYQSWTIFVPGGADVKDKDVQQKAISELKILAKQDNHFLKTSSTSELEHYFRYVAQSLTDSWKVISCFISAGQNGQVCWTFGKNIKKSEQKPLPPPTPPTPKRGRNIFLGLNGTIGVPVIFNDYDSYFGMNLKFGIDFAYPVSDRFAIGAYTFIGGGPALAIGSEQMSGLFDFKVGLLMLTGDVNDQPFIIGISPFIGINTFDIPFEFRFGRIVKEHLYITGNVDLGFFSGFYIEPSITIGYHFGDLLQTRK